MWSFARSARLIVLGLWCSLSVVAGACGFSGDEMAGEEPVEEATADDAVGVAGAGAAVDATAEDATAEGTGPTIRVMPLGDSLTAGSGEPRKRDLGQSYRGYLYSSLRAAGYRVDFVGSADTPAIGGKDHDGEGHSGYTIGPDGAVQCKGCPPANLSDNIDTWLARSKPDVILLLIGVNDLFPVERQRSGLVRPTVPAEAPEKLLRLVAKIRAAAPATTILVASYPPIASLVDPDSPLAADFAALNDAARRAAEVAPRQVRYVDVFGTLATRWSKADVVADGLHPSAAGAKQIAEVFDAALRPVLDEHAGGS